jgi:hypothetical protein
MEPRAVEVRVRGMADPRSGDVVNQLIDALRRPDLASSFGDVWYHAVTEKARGPRLV